MKFFSTDWHFTISSAHGIVKNKASVANWENIMITAGGIQPMNLLCQLFINPVNVILVEFPAFVHATMIFEMFKAAQQKKLLLNQLESLDNSFVQSYKKECIA